MKTLTKEEQQQLILKNKQERKARKEANRAARREESKSIDSDLQQKKIQEQIEFYGKNRKSRRQFRKMTGFIIPPLHMPHVIAHGYGACACDACSDRRKVEELKKKNASKSKDK